MHKEYIITEKIKKKKNLLSIHQESIQIQFTSLEILLLNQVRLRKECDQELCE